MPNKIQIRRGNQADLPVFLDSGEFGLSVDDSRLFIGDGTLNLEIAMMNSIWDIFDANTILAADTDNTPTARTIAEQQVVARLTSGNIGGVDIGISDNDIVQIDGSPSDNEFARFTANGLEGRTYAEVLASLSGQADANFAWNSKKLTGLLDPTLAQDAATKAYVDSVSIGLDFKESCRVGTIAVLPANTPAGSGIGKTLTADAVGVLTIDGVATVLNDRILVKNQAAGDDNGIYKVTTEGTAGVEFVLTRAIDFDQNTEVTAGAFMFITEGTVLADQGWVLTTNDPITVDTTSLVFVQFSSAGTVVAHKDTHDPDDGSDPLDTAAAAEISVVVSAATGSSHSFSRADHVHAIAHAITDNHIVTIDSASIANGEYAKWTANGLESKSFAEVMADLSGSAGADFSMNTKKITGVVDPTANQDVATKKYVDDLLATEDTFIEHSDTPAAYAANAYSIVRVNAAANAVEFMATIDGGTFV